MANTLTTENQIKEAILSLPSEERIRLLIWFVQMDRHNWDCEIEEDFSEHGSGAKLLEQIKEDFLSGRCSRWE